MPRNNADFLGLQFRHFDTHPNSHELEAYNPKTDDVIGYLRWSKRGGLIQDVSVTPEHRRKGIATALFHHAKGLAANSAGEIPEPRHSPVRTPEGTAWARAVGH